MTGMDPRRLDALLAVALFGWKRGSHEGRPRHETYVGPNGEKKIINNGDAKQMHDTLELGEWSNPERVVMLCPYCPSQDELPEWSSTWEGLGMVAAALRAKGWDLKVYIVADTKGVDAHVHRDGEEKFYESGPHASATDAPEAVALAALKALGVEVTA